MFVTFSIFTKWSLCDQKTKHKKKKNIDVLVVNQIISLPDFEKTMVNIPNANKNNHLFLKC